MSNKNFLEVLKKAALKSEEIHWILTNKGEAASSTLNFLHACIGNVPEFKRSRIYKKLGGDKKQIEATIYELITHELLVRLGHSPEFEPKVNELTPDLSFRVKEKLFIADVHVTHSPKKTLFTTIIKIRDRIMKLLGSFDSSSVSESRAEKIARIIEEKSATYRHCHIPLVIFLFLGDHHALSEHDVEKALYGLTTQEIKMESKFPSSVGSTDTLLGGILLHDEGPNFRHSHLSAVVTCDWFDTLNRTDKGKRLYCLVLHNFNAIEHLPEKAFQAFQPFQQVMWERHTKNGLKPKITTIDNMVVKFSDDGRVEFHRYTADSPW